MSPESPERRRHGRVPIDSPAQFVAAQGGEADTRTNHAKDARDLAGFSQLIRVARAAIRRPRGLLPRPAQSRADRDVRGAGVMNFDSWRLDSFTPAFTITESGAPARSPSGVDSDLAAGPLG